MHSPGKRVCAAEHDSEIGASIREIKASIAKGDADIRIAHRNTQVGTSILTLSTQTTHSTVSHLYAP